MLFHDKLHEIAGLYPKSPAVIFGEGTMTYEELDRSSDEIAAELSSVGVGCGDIVPIEQELDPKWFACAIGIIKTGAAYAAISHTLPTTRREYILRDIKTGSGAGNERPFTVLYTSGSTGEPKGVLISHDNLSAVSETTVEALNICPGFRMGVFPDVGFDTFLLSTFAVLFSGGVVCLTSKNDRSSLIGAHRFLMKNKVHATFLTTQLAVEYMRSFDNKYLKFLLTGGESLRKYTPRSYDLYNGYGPTECTVYVTAHKLSPEEAEDPSDIPIGAPVGKNRIYLIDGEICISGPQVALGYLNRPDETANRFVPNPYYALGDDNSYSRMYLTGDLAEWTKNGELLFRGRIDNQVKISGVRIEPGEIEMVLAKNPDLLASCVTVKHNKDGEAFLAAYCVPRVKELSRDDIKNFLLKSLPANMLPSDIILIERLPIDPRTGKVDIHALRD